MGMMIVNRVNQHFRINMVVLVVEMLGFIVAPNLSPAVVHLTKRVIKCSGYFGFPQAVTQNPIIPVFQKTQSALRLTP